MPPHIENEYSDDLKKLTSDYQYLGWVPCVIGKLDFSKISTSQLSCSLKEASSKPISFTYIDEHSPSTIEDRVRYNVVSSVFNWKDRKDEKGEYEGHFRFITIAKTEKNGALEGTAFLVLHSDVVDEPSFIEHVLSPLQDLSDKIEEYENALSRNQYNPDCELDREVIADELQRIERVIVSFSLNQLKHRIITVKYSIQESGLVFLKPELRIGIDDDPEKKKQAEQSNFIAVKQSFIYIKYSLHKHKHHRKEEDRLTSIHRINSSQPNETALRLIDDLRRSVIEIKERDIENLEYPKHFVQGFISYTKSLIQALCEMTFICSATSESKKSYFDNMLHSWQSVAHRADEQKQKREQTKENNSKAMSETFQGLSIMVATFSLLFYGIRFAYLADNDIAQKIDGKKLEFLKPFFNDSEFILYTFVSLFFLIIIFVSLRIIINPHGFIRRILAYLFNMICGKIMIMTRVIIIAALVFTLTLLVNKF